jgi:hypothetical protein
MSRSIRVGSGQEEGVHVMDFVAARGASAESVTAHHVTVTPQSRTLIVRLPNGGFVWNRPTAVLVEQDGRVRRIPIVDFTRILQAGLLGLAMVTVGASLLGCRRRRGGAS